MSKTKFRVLPLPTHTAETARAAAAKGAPDHRTVVADSPPQAFPCRHCLQWAQPGERMILFPFEAIPPGHPYSERGPIFVHEENCPRYATTDRYPDQFANGRAFRAYNSRYDIIEAQIANGTPVEAIIEKLLQNPETVFVDARSATHGCYTFRLEPI